MGRVGAAGAAQAAAGIAAPEALAKQSYGCETAVEEGAYDTGIAVPNALIVLGHGSIFDPIVEAFRKDSSQPISCSDRIASAGLESR